MKLIQRFDLSIEQRQQVLIPFNSEIIGFGEFNKNPCIWALVDPDQKPQARTFVIVAENKDLDPTVNKTRYLGRFEATAEVGKRMVHVFEE